MTRDEALILLYDYGRYVNRMLIHEGFCAPKHPPALSDVVGMWNRFPSEGSKAKAMRWLGYMQGVCVASEVFTLDQVKEHSKNKRFS